MKGKFIKSGKSLISFVLVAMMVVSLFTMNVSAAQVSTEDSSASKTVDSSSASKDVDSAGANVDLNKSGDISNWYVYLYDNSNKYFGEATISGSSGSATYDLTNYRNTTIKLKVQADENGRKGQKINNNGSISKDTEYKMDWQNSETNDMCSYYVPATASVVTFNIYYNNGNCFKLTDAAYYICGEFNNTNWAGQKMTCVSSTDYTYTFPNSNYLNKNFIISSTSSSSNNTNAYLGACTGCTMSGGNDGNWNFNDFKVTALSSGYSYPITIHYNPSTNFVWGTADKGGTSTGSTWYLCGYINGIDVDSKNESKYQFTLKSGSTTEYVLTYTAKQDEYVVMSDGTNLYRPTSNNASSGTAGPLSGDSNPRNQPKWWVSGVTDGDVITYTWNSSTKVLSWIVKSQGEEPEPTEGYKLLIGGNVGDQTTGIYPLSNVILKYNSATKKFEATYSITLSSYKYEELPMSLVKFEEGSKDVTLASGGYWLATGETTTKTMTEGKAVQDNLYVSSDSAIKSTGTTTVYIIYDADTQSLTVTTVQPKNPLYADLRHLDAFKPYLECTHDNYKSTFNDKYTMRCTYTISGKSYTEDMVYDTTDNDKYGMEKGIFVGNFPSDVYNASSFRFQLWTGSSQVGSCDYTTSLKPARAGQVFTYDNGNTTGWTNYKTYYAGSQKRKEASLKDLGINLADTTTMGLGNSKYIFFNNAYVNWSQVYMYVWGKKLPTGVSSGTRFELTKLVTNSEDTKYQMDNYKHVIDVSNLWVLDLSEALNCTAAEATKWLKCAVDGEGDNIDEGFLFIDRGPLKVFPMSYSYSVDITDDKINYKDFVANADKQKTLTFKTNYNNEYYPCFLAEDYLHCSQRISQPNDTWKYRAYAPGFYDLVQYVDDSNKVRTAGVTLYLDLHNKPKDVKIYIDNTSLIKDASHRPVSDIDYASLKRLGNSTIYSATFNLPFDYTLVESGLTEYSSPMFQFRDIKVLGTDDDYHTYTFSAKAQPSGQCAADQYGTGEVWIESSNLYLDSSKGIVSSSSTQSLYSSSAALEDDSDDNSKDIIASGAGAEVVESGASVDLISAGYDINGDVYFDNNKTKWSNVYLFIGKSDWVSAYKMEHQGNNIYKYSINWGGATAIFFASSDDKSFGNNGKSANIGGTKSTLTSGSYTSNYGSSSSIPCGTDNCYVPAGTSNGTSLSTKSVAEVLDGYGIVSDDIISVLNGTKIMFYVGEYVSWGQNTLYLNTTASSSGATSVSLSNTGSSSPGPGSDRYGYVTLPAAQYYVTHESNFSYQPRMSAIAVAGNYYLVDSTTPSIYANLSLSGGVTTISGSTVTTTTAGGKSGVGKSYSLVYYIKSGTTYTKVGTTASEATTYLKGLSEGTHTLYTCFTDGNITILRDTDIYTAAVTYTVTFNANGHGTAPAAQSVTSGKYATKPTDPTATGYDFGGWYTDSSCTGTAFNFTSTPITSNINLWAKWTAKTFTLTFNAGTGGSVTPPTMQVTYNSTYPTLPVPTRDYYDFDGWYTGQNGAGTKIVAGNTVAITASTTVYAKWVGKTYNITLRYKNPGSNIFTEKTDTYTYGTAKTISAPTIPSGYTFDGWYTDEACTTGKTSGITATDNGDKTFYGKFNAATYTLTYNGNGVTVSPGSKSVTYGEKYGDLPELTRTGYTFGGWYTALTGGTRVTKDSVYNTAGNSTIYARWTPLPFKITASAGANGQVSPSGETTINYDASLTFTASPNTGYKVSCWKVDGTVQSGQKGTTFTYKQSDLNSHTVSVEFEEKTSTTIYVGFVEYCFTTTDSKDGSYMSSTPTVKIGSHSNVTISQSDTVAYFHVSEWNKPIKFYVKAVELSEDEYTSSTRVQFYDGSTLKKSDTSAIAENNFYLYYNYSSVKTITYPETDRLYSIRYNSGASEKCSGITFTFSGFNEKIKSTDSETYVKSSTTVTATATPTNASYTIKEFVYGSRIANFKQNGNTATFNVVDNDATLGAKFTDIMKLQCIQTSYIYYTIEGTEYIDVRSIDQVIGGEDKIFGSGKTITVKIKVSEAGIEAGFCIGSVTRSGADDFELRYTDSSQTEATLTFTIGLANIKIDPNIKSNKIGVTVFAEDEEGNPVIAFDGESEKHFAGYIGGDVVLTAPTIPGYRFDGWYMDDEIGGLLSKKLTYRVPGEYFTESFNVYARYEKISVDQNFGILSYSHSTYHLTSQKGTVEDTPAPVVETKKGYTSGAYETQQTGWVTRNGKNDYTVIYADYDSYVLKDFSATLKASTLPNSSAYTFLGWLQDGTVDVSKLSQNLKYGFDDIADDDAEPFTTYNIIATWDDQIYDIDLDYDYKRYNGDVVMEPDFDLKNDGVTAPTIKRTVTGVSRSSFLANIERFATDYAPIVNDTRYDYTFVYDRYVIQSNPNGATHGKIKYYAVADYGKTSVQKYSIKIGTGSPERYDIKYIKPDKTTVMKTDYGYYNWLARLTSEHEADGDTYFLWYVFTDTDHTDYDILLCTNSKNSFDIRLTAANFDKRIYLFVGKGTDKFDGKELSSLAFEYNVACNGNYVTYTNIDYTTYFNFRIDVNCPDGFKLKKMGVIYYFAEDNILPDEHDEYYVQPDGFNKNYESGKYLVDNDDLEIFARNATQDGKWMLSGNNADDPYACGVDLTAFRNADNQVIYIVPVNNQLSGGYLWNIVFVGYVIYEDSEGNEYTVFSERFVGSVPHEYYNGGNMNS